MVPLGSGNHSFENIVPEGGNASAFLLTMFLVMFIQKICNLLNENILTNVLT